MVYPQHPCRQDCLMRNGDCHSECQAYKEFEAKRNEFYKAKAVKSKESAMTDAVERGYWRGIKIQAKRSRGYHV